MRGKSSVFGSFRRDKTNADQYIAKRGYGGTGIDDYDEDSDDQNDPGLMDKTPTTRRRLVDEK